MCGGTWRWGGIKPVWKTEVPSGSLGLVLWHIVSTSKNGIKICIVVLIKITAFITKVMLTASVALVWSVSVEHDIQYYFPFGQCRRCCWVSVVKDSCFLLFWYEKLVFITDLAFQVFLVLSFIPKTKLLLLLSLVQFEMVVTRYLGVIMASSQCAALYLCKLPGRV